MSLSGSEPRAKGHELGGSVASATCQGFRFEVELSVGERRGKWVSGMPRSGKCAPKTLGGHPG